MGFFQKLFKSTKSTEPAKPKTGELGAYAISSRYSSYPSAQLIPSTLVSIFRTADSGNCKRQAELFEEMVEKDGHLAGISANRKMAVAGLEYEIVPYDEGGQAQAEFIEQSLFLKEYLEEVIQYLSSAFIFGYASLEMVWDYLENSVQVVKFNPIPHKQITFANSLVPLVTIGTKDVKIPPYKAIFHTHWLNHYYPPRAGSFRTCSWAYLFKNYATKDWASFNEIFGMPLRLGKYPPTATEEDKDAIKAALIAMGTDAAGIVPMDAVIEFVEAQQRMATSSNPYDQMITHCNKEMSKAILGQTLTTDAGQTGSYAQAKVHEQVRKDIVLADALAIAKTLRTQLFRPLIGFNFGWEHQPPFIKFNTEKAGDQLLMAQVYQLISSMGFDIDPEYINYTFGVSVTKREQPQVGDQNDKSKPDSGSKSGN